MKHEDTEAKGAGNITRLNVPFEIKSIDDSTDDGFFRFEGLASTFGNIDKVNDVVLPGAFTESLKKTTPVILWQHKMVEPIGMPEEIKEVPEGLFIRGRLPKDDSLVSGRVIPQIKVGSISTMSIGFRTRKSNTDQVTGIRELIELDLAEVSLVTIEANEMAKITGFKSEEQDLENNTPLIIDVDGVKEIKTKRDFEKTLRDSGVFSKKAATLLATFFQGEPEEENAGNQETMDSLKSLSEQLESTSISNTLNSMMKKLETTHV